MKSREAALQALEVASEQVSRLSAILTVASVALFFVSTWSILLALLPSAPEIGTPETVTITAATGGLSVAVLVIYLSLRRALERRKAAFNQIVDNLEEVGL